MPLKGEIRSYVRRPSRSRDKRAPGHSADFKEPAAMSGIHPVKRDDLSNHSASYQPQFSVYCQGCQ